MQAFSQWTEYWIFATAAIAGLATFHFLLWCRGKGDRVSGADWSMVVAFLTIGVFAVDHAMRWEDQRLIELIEKVVPAEARFVEQGVRGNVFRETREVDLRREMVSGGGDAEGRAGGATAEGAGDGTDTDRTARSSEETGPETPGVLDAEGMRAVGFLPMSDAEGEIKAVLNVDFINAGCTAMVTATRRMATAVVASLFFAVAGVAVYFRVRAEHVLSELRTARILAESEARFHLLYKSSPDAIFVQDPNGYILDTNPAACDLLRIESEKLEGAHLTSLFDQESREEAATKLRKLTEGSTDRIEDIFFKTKDGREIPVEVRARKIVYMEGPAYLLHVRDLTERRAVDHKLRQAQKMEGIGQLAAGVAHDFNNLLTVIQGHTAILIESHAGDEDLKGSLEAIGAATERAAELTAHLLTFGRKQQMHLEYLDVNDVLGNFLKLLGRVIPEHIELKIETTANVPLIHADRGMIEQVITNLAVNARDAMPRGGFLKLSTSTVEIKIEEIFERPDAKPGEYVEIKVEDTGTGMSRETLDRIFEPFFTSKDVGKGTGLGLASAYGIIAQLGGWIRVESELGKGSTFTLYLPVRKGGVLPAKEDVPDDGEVRGGRETILVVEDEPALRKLVALNLERYGYTIIKAASGREALDKWEDIKDEVDLLLTDLVMPEGVSGRELGQRLVAENGKFPIIYMSGYSEMVIGVDGDESLDFPILEKPYTSVVLARTVRATLDGRLGEALSHTLG